VIYCWGFVLQAGIQAVHFPTLQRGTGAGNMIAPKGTTERYDRKAGFGPNCVTLMSALVALSLEQQFSIVKCVKMDCAQNQYKFHGESLEANFTERAFK